MIKPLFDIQKVHVNGSKLYYELYYKKTTVYVKVIEACFITLKGAQEYRDELLEET